MKNVVESPRELFAYFNALETYSDVLKLTTLWCMKMRIILKKIFQPIRVLGMQPRHTATHLSASVQINVWKMKKVRN